MLLPLLLAAVSVEDPLVDWWAAEGPAAREALIEELLASDLDYDDLHGRLAAGRPYTGDVPKGKLLGTRDIGGVPHHWMAWIPESYDSTRKCPVRFDVHGGMGQPAWKDCDGSWSPGYAAVTEYRSDVITILPAGWWDSMWWEASQVENFEALLDELKRSYNIDENRVVFVGNSDGGVAAWFYLMRWPDPWAAYTAYVSHPARLTSTELRPDGQLHLSNLDGQEVFAVNGGRDRIINFEVMQRYVDLFRERTTINLDFRAHPKDGHALQLTDEERENFVDQLRHARRDPLPDAFSWSTERVDRYQRRAWLVIEALRADHPVDETNILPRYYGHNVPRTKPPKSKPWGKVTLRREGNTIHAATVGVARFRLLFSPDEIDFSKPVNVIVDGVTRFEGQLEPRRETLLSWAARDADRTKLFAAELVLVVP